MTSSGPEDQPVLVLAPVGRDADLACSVLGVAGLPCRTCRGIHDVLHQPLETVSAVLMTEEALSEEALGAFAALIKAQPAWSNVPVVLFVDGARRRSPPTGRRLIERLGAGRGVIVIERPIAVASFASVLRSAVLARRRQFELRDELAARATAEARARMLAQEMKHRVKNSLAIVGAIASQTFRNAPSTADALKTFSDRLSSMSRAQDLLTENGENGADFRELVGQALTPFGYATSPHRFVIEGPSVSISARAATALAMVLHELATNAVKYGALSGTSGRVAIAWRVEATSGGRQLDIAWREHGGPPVTPPKRKAMLYLTSPGDRHRVSLIERTPRCPAPFSPNRTLMTRPPPTPTSRLACGRTAGRARIAA